MDAFRQTKFPDDFTDMLVVNGHTYTCDASGGQPMWKRDAPGPGDQGCRVDSLMAGAYAVGAQASGDAINGPDACRRQMPCLQTSSGLTCFDAASTSLPAVLDATMRCVDVPHEAFKHLERTNITTHAGLRMHQVRPKSPEPPPKEPPPPPKEPPPPPKEPPPPPKEPPPPPKEELPPKVVDWFQGRAQVACAADADCPQSDPVAFDVWFEHAASKCGTSKPQRALELLKCAGTTQTSRLAWTDELKNDAPKSLAELEETLRGMYTSDERFRVSVDQTVQKSRTLRNVLRSEIAGACDSGVCRNARDARVSVRVFDGTEPVTFHDTDGGIRFSRARRMHDVHATSCDTADAPSECRDALPEIRDATLSPGDHVAEQYRLVLSTPTGDATYLVRNRVQRRDGDKRAAASVLCELAGRECPAPFCARRGAQCVPSQRVDDVQFKP